MTRSTPMAPPPSSDTWTAHLRIEEVHVTEGANHPIFIASNSDPYCGRALINLFAHNNNSDVLGYKTLERDNGDRNIDLTGSVPSKKYYQEVAIEEFVSDNICELSEAIVDGITTFVFSAWWSKTGGSPFGHKAICRAYHRDALGSETFITEFEQGLTLTESRYTKLVTITEVFEPDDRLVIKWFGAFQGSEAIPL